MPEKKTNEVESLQQKVEELTRESSLLQQRESLRDEVTYRQELLTSQIVQAKILKEINQTLKGIGLALNKMGIALEGKNQTTEEPLEETEDEEDVTDEE